MSQYRDVISFVSLAAMWGVSFMAIKAGLAIFPPVFYAAIRYYIAGFIMLLYALYVTGRWCPKERDEILTVLISGSLMFAAYHAFLYIGELSTTSAVAAVIVSLSPLLTTAFARALLPQERLTVRGFLGVTLGLLGIIIIARPDPSHLLSGAVLAKGLIFLAAASFALGSVLVKRSDSALPKETFISWAMIVGAMLMTVISLFRSEPIASIHWTIDAMIPVLYLSIVSGVIGFIIYFDLLEQVGPIEINLVSYVAPLFAALTGWLLLDEDVELYTVVGFVVIFFGFYLIKREQLGEEFSKLQKYF